MKILNMTKYNATQNTLSVSNMLLWNLKYFPNKRWLTLFCQVTHLAVGRNIKSEHFKLKRVKNCHQARFLLPLYQMTYIFYCYMHAVDLFKSFIRFIQLHGYSRTIPWHYVFCMTIICQTVLIQNLLLSQPGHIIYTYPDQST